jgi:hypothetical protein
MAASRVLPIISRTPRRMSSVRRGAAAVRLTPEDLPDIETAASRITVPGARYAEQQERLTGR